MQTLFRDGQKSRIKKDQPVEVTKAYAKAVRAVASPFCDIIYLLIHKTMKFSHFDFWGLLLDKHSGIGSLFLS